MGGADGIPISLVLVAGIAVFLGLRLRSILGTRAGFEGTPPNPPVIGRAAGPVIDVAPAPAGAAHPAPDPGTPVGRTLTAMHVIDARFDAGHFLAGAEAAFKMIVAAFTAGARDKLRPLLTDETFRAFDGAIAARESAGEVHRTEIKEMLNIKIDDAKLAGNFASITVRFVSRQINLTVGADGNPVAGTDAMTEIVDVWTFTRDLGAADLAWRLSAALSG